MAQERRAANGLLERFSQVVSEKVGTSGAFVVAVLVVLAWGISGPIFRFSNTWQLVINTATTIVTFLMVFVIQRAQNKEARAMQLKLDEIVRAMKGASDRLIDVEDLPEEELKHLREHYQALADRFHRQGKPEEARRAKETSEELAETESATR